MGVHSMLSLPSFKHPLLNFILTLGFFPTQAGMCFFQRPLDDFKVGGGEQSYQVRWAY